MIGAEPAGYGSLRTTPDICSESLAQDNEGEEDSLDADDVATLPRIPGKVPWTSYLIAFIEFAEEASFTGVGAVINNLIQRPLSEGGSGTGAPPRGSQITPGALGLGLQYATAVNMIFVMLTFTLPLVAAALSDLRWGKIKTITIGIAIGAVSHLLLVYAALPSVLPTEKALPSFLIGILLLSMSSGAIPPYAPTHDYITVLHTGQRVVVDRAATIQKIMSAFYGSINIGAFISNGSTFAEKYVGFWLAYLIPGNIDGAQVIFCMLPPMFYLVQPYLRSSPQPDNSATVELVGLLKHLAKTPSHPDRVDNYGKVVEGCKIFLFFVIFGIGDLALQPLMVSMVGSMTTNGLPNDFFLIFFNPLIVATSIPIFDNYLYPFLSSRSIPFGPIRRIVTGFLLVAGAMLWCAILQYRIYSTSPCGYHATTCGIGTGVSPMSAWWFAPTPIMTGLGEVLAMISAMELAYTMSPPALRSVAHALFISTQAASSVLVLLLTPIMRDPLLVFPFLLTGFMTLVAAALIWRLIKHLDHERT